MGNTRWRWPLLLPLIVGLGAFLLASCSQPEEAELTADGVLGRMPVPAGNPQIPEKIELGRLLFFDKRVLGGVMGCASCHDPSKGWSDGRARSQGPKGELERNSLSLFNAAWEDFPSWDGSEWSLEQHNADAIKFFGGSAADMSRVLGAVPEYRDRFERVFGGEISFDNVIRAMAAFERSLVSFDTPYDRFRAGRTSALTAQQKEGLALFTGRAGCSACHTPPLLTDSRFHVLGVPQVGPATSDPGRFAATGDERDRGAFRTPTLRNVALTGPYMHDGVFSTLEEVVGFYEAGGGNAPDSSPRLTPFTLTAEERAALVAYLQSLTDGASTRATPPTLP